MLKQFSDYIKIGIIFLTIFLFLIYPIWHILKKRYYDKKYEENILEMKNILKEINEEVTKLEEYVNSHFLPNVHYSNKEQKIKNLIHEYNPNRLIKLIKQLCHEIDYYNSDFLVLYSYSSEISEIQELNLVSKLGIVNKIQDKIDRDYERIKLNRKYSNFIENYIYGIKQVFSIITSKSIWNIIKSALKFIIIFLIIVI